MAAILTIAQIAEIFQNRNLRLYEDGRVNIFAFRSANRVANAFDDSLYIARFDGMRWKVMKFRCTTDPGLSALQNPRFPEAQKNGTAILAEGYQYQFKWAKIGEGKYRHDCLVQHGAVKIYRDNNRDNLLDFVNLETNAYAGICMHCFGNYGETERVDYRSEGCVDFQSWEEYEGEAVPYLKKYDRDGLYPFSLFPEQDILNVLR